MKRSITLLSVAALAATVALAQAQSVPLQDAGGTKRKANSSNAKLIPGSAERFREFEALSQLARKAEARGDYTLAESLYLQLTTIHGTNMPSSHLPLARLYDKQGLEREAMREYRIVVHGAKNTWSSRQEDPVVLTRYGDLCEKYGQPEEAAKAYAYASRPFKDENERMPSPLPRDRSLPALKAAAHLAAGVTLGLHGERDARTQELDLAVRLDPANWVIHFYRAIDLKSLGLWDDARREADLAERLAPASKRDFIRTLRTIERIVPEG